MSTRLKQNKTKPGFISLEVKMKNSWVLFSSSSINISCQVLNVVKVAKWLSRSQFNENLPHLDLECFSAAGCCPEVRPSKRTTTGLQV